MGRWVNLSLATSLLAAGSLMNVCACRAHPEPVSSSSSSPTSPSKPPAAPTAADTPTPAAQFRIIAVGDLHGDFETTRATLEFAGVIDHDGHWLGRQLELVQVGDLLDRGPEERRLLDYFRVLHQEALEAGGRFQVLVGNHEIANVGGDFRGVTHRGFKDFDDYWHSDSSTIRQRYTRNMRGRAAAFLPGGPLALELADSPVVLQIGDTVFAHAGLLPEHVQLGIDTINHDVSAWMRGEAPELPDYLRGNEAPFVIREFGHGHVKPRTCHDVAVVLRAMHARRIVVGHTVQPGGINATCDGALWRIDVGLSSSRGSSPPQVLEIRGDEVRVLSARR
jgi:hypothetical protein